MIEGMSDASHDSNTGKGTATNCCNGISDGIPQKRKRQPKGFVVICLLSSVVSFGLLMEWINLGSFPSTNSDDSSKLRVSQQKIIQSYVPLQPAYVPLLYWEEQNLDEERTCQPPNSMPEYCCIGSISAGGDIGFSRDSCNLGIDVYKNAEEIALATLANYPLPETDTTSVQHCDWCRIVDILIEKNWTLAFQGDSLTRQTFVGVECELRRRDLYTVTRIETFVQIDRKPRWRYGLDQIVELHVSTKNENWNTTTTSSNVAIIRSYSMYRPPEDMDIVRNNITMNNDILVFDHGLHYGYFEDGGELFLTEMTSLVDALAGNTFSNETGNDLHPEQQTKEKHRVKILAWRETSAQHFDTPGGQFLPDANFTYCAPIKPEHYKTGDWRRPLMEKIINVTGVEYPQQLDILPFYEYTSHLHGLHPGHDCSHFCSTPSLWLPLWRSLRLAIDRALIDLTDDSHTRYLFI